MERYERLRGTAPVGWSEKRKAIEEGSALIASVLSIFATRQIACKSMLVKENRCRDYASYSLVRACALRL